jgi:hypothetical protein
MFNNMVLKKICGTKRREVTGDFWTVQVIAFILGQASLYMMELYQLLRLQSVCCWLVTLRGCLILLLCQWLLNVKVESLYVEVE